MINELLRIFDEPLQIVRKVSKGSTSNNYILSAANGHLYFLKEYVTTDEDKIRLIHSVKKYFANKEVPVVLPLSLKNVNTFFKINGKYYAIFPYVSGFMSSYEDLDLQRLSSLARMLSKIHMAGATSEIKNKLELSINNTNFLNEAQNLIDIIESKNNKNHMDKMFLVGIRNKIKKYKELKEGTSPLKLKCDHLLHGDYHQDNIFFKANKEVKHVFDWEHTFKAPRILEVLRCIDVACMNGKSESENLQRTSSFIKIYKTIYPLSKTEIKEGVVANYSLNLQNLWIEKEHYEHGNNRADKFYEIRLERIDYMANNINKFTKALTMS